MRFDYDTILNRKASLEELPELPDAEVEGWAVKQAAFLKNKGFDDRNPRLFNAVARYFGRWRAAQTNDGESRPRYRKPPKGLFLLGNPGTGKSSSMQIFSWRFGVEWFTASDFAKTYSIAGEAGFWDMASGYDKMDIIIDELGGERDLKHFGNEGIMPEFLTARYDKFKHNGAYTFATSNLSEEVFRKLYGERVWSRINEMCYKVTVAGEDRRLEKGAK